MTKVTHNLELLKPENRPIAKVLLDWQSSLSDGYGWYCNWAHGLDPGEFIDRYGGDHVLATLELIADEIREARHD